MGQGARFAGFSQMILDKYAVLGDYPWNPAVMQFLVRNEEVEHQDRELRETIHITLNLLRIYLGQNQKGRDILGNSNIFFSNLKQNIEMNLNLIRMNGGKVSELIRHLYVMGQGLGEEERAQVFLQLEQMVPESSPVLPAKNREVSSGFFPCSMGVPFKHMMTVVIDHRHMLSGRELFRQSVERQQNEFYMSMMRDYVAGRTESLIQVYLQRNLMPSERQLVKEYINRMEQDELIEDIRYDDQWIYEEAAGMILHQIQPEGGIWSHKDADVEGPEREGPHAPDKLAQTELLEKAEKTPAVSILLEAGNQIYRMEESVLKDVPELFERLPEPVYAVLEEHTDRWIFRKEAGQAGQEALLAAWQSSGLREKRRLLEEVTEAVQAALSSKAQDRADKEEKSELNNIKEGLGRIKEYDIRCSRMLESIQRQVPEWNQIPLEQWFSESKTEGVERRPVLSEVREGFLSETVDWVSHMEHIWKQELPELIVKLPEPVYNTVAEALAGSLPLQENPGEEDPGNSWRLLPIWQTSDLETRREILVQVWELVKESLSSAHNEREKQVLMKTAKRLDEIQEHNISSLRLQEFFQSREAGAWVKHTEDSWLSELPELIMKLPEPVYRTVTEALARSLLMQTDSGEEGPGEKGLGGEVPEMSRKFLTVWQTENLETRRQLLIRVWELVNEAAASAGDEREKQDLIETVKRLDEIREYEMSNSRIQELFQSQEAKEWVNYTQDSWLSELPELIMKLPEPVYRTVTEALARSLLMQTDSGEEGPGEKGLGGEVPGREVHEASREFLPVWQAADLETRRQLLIQVWELVKGAAASAGDEREKQVLIETAKRLDEIREHDMSISRIQELFQSQEDKERVNYTEDSWMPELIMKLPEPVYKTVTEALGRNLPVQTGSGEEDLGTSREFLPVWQAADLETRRQLLIQVWELVKEAAASAGDEREKQVLIETAKRLDEVRERRISNSRIQELFQSREAREWVNHPKDSWIQELPELIMKLPEPVFKTVAAAMAENLPVRSMQSDHIDKGSGEHWEFLQVWQTTSLENRRQLLTQMTKVVNQSPSTHGNEKEMLSMEPLPKLIMKLPEPDLHLRTFLQQEQTNPLGEVLESLMVHAVRQQVQEKHETVHKSLQEIEALETRITAQEYVIDQEKHHMEDLRKMLIEYKDEMKHVQEKQMPFLKNSSRADKLTRKTMDQIKTELRLERIRHGLD